LHQTVLIRFKVASETERKVIDATYVAQRLQLVEARSNEPGDHPVVVVYCSAGIICEVQRVDMLTDEQRVWIQLQNGLTERSQHKYMLEYAPCNYLFANAICVASKLKPNDW